MGQIWLETIFGTKVRLEDVEDPEELVNPNAYYDYIAGAGGDEDYDGDDESSDEDGSDDSEDGDVDFGE
jgi:hypothetical protein